jgi:hypothetical protein
LGADLNRTTGETVAVDQETGKAAWGDMLSSSPYNAAAVTNKGVFAMT